MNIKALQFLTCLLVFSLSACKPLARFVRTPTALPSLTVTATATSSATHTSTATFTPTATATQTGTPTITLTPTLTHTPTITLSPTFDFPDGVVNVAQANCRYGPGTAYQYSHGLYEGDHVIVDGRTYSGTWLWVKPDNLNRHCWAAASVFNITGDVMRVLRAEVVLPKTTFASPPTGLKAMRNGDEVSLTWDAADYIPEGDRRGYLLEVYVCQYQTYTWMAIQTDNNSITIPDGRDCKQPSSGLLYIAEKHGYTDPVKIPWP